MGEVKSVKVDNWGVFFLQKLQNFFNKTDYCDLTLQFRDNSQLKVHRLVLSACTDYFNVLEQTCEIIDDALIMPNEFQADVVVPIVNFMYTGTLEFELKMYGKLLRTAKEMNMTVLLKLLEAHRRTMENVNRQQRPPSPKGIRRSRGAMQVSPQRNISVTQATRGSPQTPQQQQQVRRTNANIGMGSQLRGSGGAASAHSKQEQSTSPFEQLRKGYNNNKRPANTSILSPPSKKPNLEDVKEFAEQQRMRKQIAAEYGEDNEYEGMLDDDIHADDDDDDLGPSATPNTASSATKSGSAQTSPQTTQVEHGSATIFFKHETDDQPPTIIVKDSSNAKLNHAKIIAEVLRKYPHLVKGQKNIKLKIMPNTPSGTSQKNIKKESSDDASISPPKKPQTGAKSVATTPAQTQTIHKTPLRESTTQKVASTQATNTSVNNKAPAASVVAQSPVQPQKRRIDSRTMHALIALGAENTEGPWLCLRCGVNGRPISIPSYRGFRRHLIHTHKEIIDPALCEYCGWRSSSDPELHLHVQVDHKVKSTQYTFVECPLCTELYLDDEHLSAHINEIHPDESEPKQQCIYCNQIFTKELDLYTHLKTYHKSQALDDGIIDDTDTEEYIGSQDEDENEPMQQQQQHLSPKRESKVKILSDISLPGTSPLVQKASTETTTATTTESEVKFVGADGNEVQLTDEQRKEILAQLSQQEQQGNVSGGVLMVLNEPTELADADQQAVRADLTDTKSGGGTTEESLGESEVHDEGDADASSMAEEYDDSQIFNELNAQNDINESKKSENAQIDESKESLENLEWAENLISEHEMQSEASSSANKSIEKPQNTVLTDKLKELTCDWSEDENDEDMEPPAKKLETEDAIEKETKNEEVDTKSVNEEQPRIEKMDVDADAEEQDDIDLAMQSLHQEESNASEAVPETQVPEIKEIKTEKATAPKKSEKIAPKLEDETEANIDKDLDNIGVKTESGDELTPPIKEKITSSSSTEVESIKQEQTSDVANEDAVTHLETEVMKRALLDELIAEADKAKDDNDNAEEHNVDVAQQQAALDEALAAVTEKSDNKIDDATVSATKDIPEEEKKIDSKETTEEEIKLNEESTVSVEETKKQRSSSSSSSNNAEHTPAAISSGSETVAKVKSLISEWVDDVEDEEDDVSAEKANNESTITSDTITTTTAIETATDVDDKIKEKL